MKPMTQRRQRPRIEAPPRRLPRALRRLRRWLGYSLAGLVILAGLCVALASQLLPLLANHPQAVADWLTAQAGRPVALSGLRAAWTRQGPKFDLDGLRIGAGGERLDIGRAELQLDLYAGLFPGKPLTSLQLTGLELDLVRDADGRWQLLGLDRSAPEQTAGNPLKQLDGLGELLLHQARLRLRDERRGLRFELPRIDARLRAAGDAMRIGLRAQRDGGAPLTLVLALDAGRGDGHGYLGSERVELADWRALLPFDSSALAAGQLDGGVWFSLSGGEVDAVEFALALSGLRLDASADAEDPATAAADQLALPSLALGGRWHRTLDGWRLGMDLPWPQGQKSHAAVERSGDRLQVEAADWPLAPFALVAAHWPGIAVPMRQWLAEAAPRGSLQGLRGEWRDGRLHWVDGRVEQFGFAAVDDTPGIDGLALAFGGNAAGWTIEPLGTPLTLDWPPALRAPEQIALHGRLQLFRDAEAQWALDIEALDIRGEDYGVELAGGLLFDGGAPSASLRAAVAPGPAVAAKRWWIRHKMPAGTVEWLDEAIEDGWIERGAMVLQGDLDDWPFDQAEGRFEAEADLRDVRLRFRPDWPVAEGLAGNARFIDDGMLIEMSGQILALQARHALGRIAEFDHPLLELQVSADGSGPAMLELLRQSPLQASHGEHFDGLTIGGRGQIELDLQIPLDTELGEPQVRGLVQLEAAALADTRWGIAFEQASGPVRFSERGVAAEGLEVRFGDQPGRFDLAIGSFSADPGHAAEARLQGRFEPRTLLAAQPAVEWLQPFMIGASEWLLELAVPIDSDSVPTRLRVRSDLVGTRLALPAPLAKSAAVQMPLDLAIDLPSERGKLELKLGELLRLYGRLSDDGRFDGVAAFGAVAAVERPERGLRVVGQVPVLDIGGWAGLALATGDGEGLIADLDLAAGEIDLLERNFSETRLRLSRAADGSARLAVDGVPLQGTVDLPPEGLRALRGITGRFDRLHWPEARPGAVSFSAGDPAAIPPLHFWVGDLRIGESRLGEARLETFPVEQGMRIERFETRSPALELFARGDWTREGLRQRSTFALDFTAQDLGAMLRALGFEALVEGGQTLAKLQATWPGAPTGFSLEEIDGSLEVSVGRGRIPEVDPGGAGRVFGLLSLSEIPRRLALDFSDFFRAGLAFTRIEGSFTLDDGNALTDDLRIDGPAAEIRIRGRTGLKAQDYQQTMEVLPRAGSVLPIVGALAGGPAGAAIGAVAQAVLSRPFKQFTRTLYSVEGSWKEPMIEVLEKGPARGEP
jgi:uncharacterized protein (TIGR02099 family)